MCFPIAAGGRWCDPYWAIQFEIEAACSQFREKGAPAQEQGWGQGIPQSESKEDGKAKGIAQEATAQAKESFPQTEARASSVQEVKGSWWWRAGHTSRWGGGWGPSQAGMRSLQVCIQRVQNVQKSEVQTPQAQVGFVSSPGLLWFPLSLSVWKLYVQNHSKLYIYIEYWFEGDQMGDLQPNFKSILVQNAATTCVARVVATTGRVNLATCFLLEAFQVLQSRDLTCLSEQGWPPPWCILTCSSAAVHADHIGGAYGFWTFKRG